MDPRERESIERDLASRDEEVRRLAVQRVGLLPDAEALALLAGALGDASWRVRKAAVERLAEFRDIASACDVLVRALADGENPGRRNAAVEALVRCGRRAVPQLLEASGASDVDVRKLAVDALAGIVDPQVPRRLVELLGDPDPNVRAAAADALASAGGRAAIDPLLQAAACEDEDPLVRLSALRALAELEAEVGVEVVADALARPLLRPAALALLAHSDDAGAPEVLLKALATPSRAAREAAMGSLLYTLTRTPEGAESLVGRLRETLAAVPEFVDDAAERLATADLSSQLMLVQVLGLLEVPRVVRPILEAGRDGALREVVERVLAGMATAEGELVGCWPRLEFTDRALACTVLGRTGGEPALRTLLAALDDPEPEVRVAAARALAGLGHPAAVAPLVRRLGLAARPGSWDPEDEVAALGESLVALADVPAVREAPDALVGLLAERLNATEPERVQITRVLARLGGGEASRALTLLLSDPAPAVRRAAVEALARCDVTSESLRAALADDAPSVRIAAATALGDSPDPVALEDLRRLACDDDPRVRAAAVRAAARSARANPEARAAALALLGGALEDEGGVVLAAVEGLERLADPAAARTAARVLVGDVPEILLTAVRCLATHGEREDLDALLPLVGHREWSVRAEAIQALAERAVVRALPPILRRLETEQDEFVRAVILRALKRLEA